MNNFAHKHVRLVLTCDACPEQYDAFIGDENVGYFRLRHGEFRVDASDGRTVYEALPEGAGAFEEGERDEYLRAGIDALLADMETRA